MNLKFVLLIIAFGISKLSYALDEYSEYSHLPDFAIPERFFTDGDYLPVSYLSSYPIDTKKLLSTELQHKLGCLFIAASIATNSKYEQDYLLEIEAPIFQVLLTYYPNLSIEKYVRGNYFLGDIADGLKKENIECRFKRPKIKKSTKGS